MHANRIVCPVDFSPASEAALILASKIASSERGSIFIVHVAEPESLVHPGMFGYHPPATHAVRKKLKALVPPDSVHYEHHFMIGDPAEHIVDFANEVDADLIVMGTHGRNVMERILMGSVAQKVLRNAMVPVLTLRPTISTQIAATA